MQQEQAELHGIYFLENEVVTIEGVRFLGRDAVDRLRVFLARPGAYRTCAWPKTPSMTFA